MSSVDMSTVDKIVKALDKIVKALDKNVKALDKILKIANLVLKLSRLLTFLKSATYSRFLWFFLTKTDRGVTRSLSLKGFSNRTRNS